MNSALKTRAKLSVDQVIEIFNSKGTATISAANVARQYGISEKTVRDIWKGRTWCGETWHLDTTRVVHTKPIGRPKGCKDSKPRKPKSDSADDLAPDSVVGDDASAHSGSESSGSGDRVHAVSSLADFSTMDGYDASCAVHSTSAPCRPHDALPPSPRQSTGAAQSVDQQLHE